MSTVLTLAADRQGAPSTGPERRLATRGQLDIPRVQNAVEVLFEVLDGFGVQRGPITARGERGVLRSLSALLQIGSPPP